MPSIESSILVLFVVALFASTVNGAIGYGFSSLTVPLALLFFPNKVLSPALVLVELAINSWVVALNRERLAAARKRAIPIVIGLVPGVLAGSYLLTRAHPGVLKLWTYVALLPLILSQAAGYRRPIRAEHAAGLPLGFGVGVLYSTTTISGPPLALMFNNQGVDKSEFRAALGTVRVAETVMTAVVYWLLGLFSSRSFHLVGPIAPAVLVGLPLGTYLIRHVPNETFRRLCMSFDAWIVGFGLARTLLELGLLGASGAYSIWGAVVLFDLYLLYRYFVTGRLRSAIGDPSARATTA
jgi:uncharacterized protein